MLVCVGGRRRNDLKVGMKVLCVCGFRLDMIHTPGNPEGKV